MSSPGQKRGTCGHIMAVFDGHLKCARSRDKGLEMIRVFSRKLVLSTRLLLQSRSNNFQLPPTETERTGTRRWFPPPPPPLSWTLHKLVCWDGNPCWQEEKNYESPKPSSKKKSSSKPRSNELKDLDEKWTECFSRLEAMLLSKTFSVPVEPVRTPPPPPSVVTCDQPFFDPGTSISGLSSGVTDGGAGSSFFQTTGDPAVLTATHHVEAPGTRGPVTAIKSATRSVEGPGMSVVIQQKPPSLLMLLVQGRPPSLLMLSVQALKFC